MTCGRNSRMTRTSASVVTSIGSSAKQPSGSGGSGSPSGSPESTNPSHRCCTPRISCALAISRRRTSGMLRRISGSCCNAGLSTSPRSPPVQETTSTSTPSAAYFAIVAAPLLDSSSGCACTAISRSRSPTSTPAHVLEPVITDNGSSTMDLVPHHVTVPAGAPTEGLPVPLPRPAPGTAKWWVVGCRRVPARHGPGHLVGAGQHARPGHVDRPRLRARRPTAASA